MTKNLQPRDSCDERIDQTALESHVYRLAGAIVARHLVALGYDILCVAYVSEAARLLDAGARATSVVLSAELSKQATQLARHGCEPAICTMAMAQARAAETTGAEIRIHPKCSLPKTRSGMMTVAACCCQSFRSGSAHSLPSKAGQIMGRFPG